MADRPNPAQASLSALRALRVATPDPTGTRTVDHTALGMALDRIATDGPSTLPSMRDELDAYISAMSAVDPDSSTSAECQAFWINVYNAGALRLAADAFSDASSSVLRVPGAFSSPFIIVDGEQMSLDDVEHGKIRRFKDPRVHGALVCGSVSCPSLRAEPFTGHDLDRQLDTQMRAFLDGGAAVYDIRNNDLALSRIFLWYGTDFVRPDRMPLLGTAQKDLVAATVAWWLPQDVQRLVWMSRPKVAFQNYDWRLGCSVS
ncbi:MAG: DUF547 domain-containing protein [Acidimicrobiia bacterium]